MWPATILHRAQGRRSGEDGVRSRLHQARAYDMVLNGNEVGGGSIRIHEAAVQRKMFEALGFSKESYESQFGYFIQALEHGARRMAASPSVWIV